MSFKKDLFAAGTLSLLVPVAVKVLGTFCRCSRPMQDAAFSLRRTLHRERVAAGSGRHYQLLIKERKLQRHFVVCKKNSAKTGLFKFKDKVTWTVLRCLEVNVIKLLI